jgi:hypothetical protein
VLDANGKVLAKSKPIQRDGLSIAVEWADAFHPPAAPVTLKLTLANAKLFALWCE